MKAYVLIWGGGDLASGIALRLSRVGIPLLVIETPQPLAVRRTVSYAQAVYDGSVVIEGIKGQRVGQWDEIETAWYENTIPVLIDPKLNKIQAHEPLVLVDARMRKRFVPLDLGLADLVIGLGPGFTAGENCHAAVETNRGHFLGRVYWTGSPEPDTGIPGQVQAYAKERVLHAPQDGVVNNHVRIGDLVKKGEAILSVDGSQVESPFDGIVRGLIHEGIQVRTGMKVGDVDPRPEPFRCWTVSEKSLAIGGGVLEAILTKEEIRMKLWED
jgi:xanthine dehydrogenase accessory factor